MSAIKALQRAGSGPNPAADFADQLTRDPFTAAFLGGRTVDVTTTGASFVDIVHGLGSAYIGAFLVASSATGHAVALLPETALELGVDVKTKARFVATSAGTWRFRVF